MSTIKKLSILFLLLLNACVYKLQIQQGNNLEQEDIDKLRTGLTKNQVVFVLGTPVIKDSFSDDRWVYLYSYKNENKETYTKKRLILFFEDNKLVTADGDYTIPETLVKAKTE